MKEEEWKTIEGFENYKISSHGRVVSLKTKLILKYRKGRGGYRRVMLSSPGKAPKNLVVHRLVCKAFCDGYAEGLTVNHKDGNILNNYYENLEWVTWLENANHRKIGKNTTSKYAGVYWNETCKKWASNLTIKGKRVHLGVHETEELASEARIAAMEANGIKSRYSGKL